MLIKKSALEVLEKDVAGFVILLMPRGCRIGYCIGFDSTVPIAPRTSQSCRRMSAFVHCGNALDAGFSLYRSTRSSRYNPIS